MKYVVHTQNLSKMYGKKLVLDRVTLNIEKGSICGLVGVNGSGKTTFMRIITGLAMPSAGAYRLFESNKLTFGQKRIGSLIESVGVYNNLSVRENLEYFRILYGIPEKSETEMILHKTGLTNEAKKKVKKLSLGMKQRLGIAIALLGNPDFLVLDEPMNGLDPKGVFEIRNLLIELNQEYGVTILISSHILSELYKMATSYIIINKGRVIKQLSKEELEDKVNTYIRIAVDKNNIEKASIVLETILNIKDYEVLHNNTIKIFTREDISKINITFAKEGINVISLSYAGDDVEDYFFLFEIKIIINKE